MDYFIHGMIMGHKEIKSREKRNPRDSGVERKS